MLILFIIIIIIVISLSIYHILNPRKKYKSLGPSPGPPDKYLLDLYNDKTYDNNNIPNGRF